MEGNGDPSAGLHPPVGTPRKPPSSTSSSRVCGEPALRSRPPVVEAREGIGRGDLVQARQRLKPADGAAPGT